MNLRFRWREFRWLQKVDVGNDVYWCWSTLKDLINAWRRNGSLAEIKKGINGWMILKFLGNLLGYHPVTAVSITWHLASLCPKFYPCPGKFPVGFAGLRRLRVFFLPSVTIIRCFWSFNFGVWNLNALCCRELMWVRPAPGEFWFSRVMEHFAQSAIAGKACSDSLRRVASGIHRVFIKQI